MKKDLLKGRLLTQMELIKFDKAFTNYSAAQLPAMRENGRKIQCLRCQSWHTKREVKLPAGVFFCPACIQLGRVRSDQPLYHLPQELFPRGKKYLRWTGTLTADQVCLSDQLIQAQKNGKPVLVQAVTGAGKTEMIYNLVAKTLNNGGCVGIASPRIDVVLELEKRFSRDFNLPIAVLHGKGKEYFRTPLIIATTHQLLRFQFAFDLLIIDEVDAFPYADDPMLYLAATRSMKKQGQLVFLTATTTPTLEQMVHNGQLNLLQLARRFHGHPLVVPRLSRQSSLMAAIKAQRQTGFPLLIFAPEIHWGKLLSEKIKTVFPTEKISFVSSKSTDRLELVQDFRRGEGPILVSTTILERGVTFPKVDVFVAKASHKTFSKSALVQIAGRAGRSIERPTGSVLFFHEGRTQAMLKAIQEIRAMNRLGGF